MMPLFAMLYLLGAFLISAGLFSLVASGKRFKYSLAFEFITIGLACIATAASVHLDSSTAEIFAVTLLVALSAFSLLSLWIFHPLQTR